MARLIDAGGAVRRAVWRLLTDEDLAWAIAAWSDGGAAEDGADETPPT